MTLLDLIKRYEIVAKRGTHMIRTDDYYFFTRSAAERTLKGLVHENRADNPDVEFCIRRVW